MNILIMEDNEVHYMNKIIISLLRGIFQIWKKVDVYNIRRENMNNFKERGKLEEGEYSISVHVWILDGKNIRIQKRSANKKIFPNLWEQSGGGVISGETSLDAVNATRRD